MSDGFLRLGLALLIAFGLLAATSIPRRVPCLTLAPPTREGPSGDARVDDLRTEEWHERTVHWAAYARETCRIP